MLEVKNLCKTYKPKKGVPVKALDNVSLTIEEKGLVFILGKSGSGKSTLLNMLGGLDKYDSGEIIIKGKSSMNFSQSDFDSYRNTYIGFIFQEYNILNEFSVKNNIALALHLQGKKSTPEIVNNILEEVDLKGYGGRKPSELSGGQKQRVAIARALIKEPEIILADEPTGALDSRTGIQVFDTLKKLSKNKLVIVVSHDREFAEQYGDRIIEFADGKVISDTIKSSSEPKMSADGITVVNDSIIKIKKGHKLTNKDLDYINACISSGDTFISSDSRCNSQLNQTAKIDEAGNVDVFREAKREDIKAKSYTEKDFKVIKSRLPFSNMLKIGSSALKAKPIRLFMTIMLSAIAFVMFGLIDTFAAYNKVDTTVSALEYANDNYVAYQKMEKQTYDDYSYYNTGKMSLKEIEEFATNHQTSAIPLYSTDKLYELNSDAYYDTTNLQNSFYFYGRNSYGSAVVLDQAKMAKFNLTMLDGRLPNQKNEIAIPKITYLAYKEAGYKTANNEKVTINSPNDLINKVIKSQYGYTDFTIVGIVEDGFNANGEYDALKNNSSDYSLQAKYTELMRSTLYGAIYVSQSYIDANISNQAYDLYTQINIDGYEDSLSSFYDVNKCDFNIFYGTGSSLSRNGIAVNFNMMYNILQYNGKLENDMFIDLNSEIGALVREKLSTYLDANFSEKNNENGDYYLVSDFANDELNKYLINVSDNIVYRYYLENEVMNSFYMNTTEFTLFSKSYQDYTDEYFETKGNDQFERIAKKMLNIISASNYSITVDGASVNASIEAMYLPSIAEFYQYNNRAICSLDLIKEMYSKNQYTTFIDNENCISSFIISQPSSTAELSKLVKEMYDNQGEDTYYLIVNNAANSVDTVNSMIESFQQIFLIAGIVCLCFSVLLMMNFIAVSISYKKREIGILRAVGARSTDVFGIFLVESVIIAIINAVLAVVASGLIISMALNPTFADTLGLNFRMLNFSIRQIAIIIAVSLAVAFLASFVPVMSIARKKPIESIKNA